MASESVPVGVQREAASRSVPDVGETSGHPQCCGEPEPLGSPFSLVYSPYRDRMAAQTDFRRAHEGHQIALPPLRSRSRPTCLDCGVTLAYGSERGGENYGEDVNS